MCEAIGVARHNLVFLFQVLNRLQECTPKTSHLFTVHRSSYYYFSPTSTKPVGLKIEIKLNVQWSGSHESEKLLLFGNVFRNARALPLWTAMEIRWNRSCVSSGSELIKAILFPMSLVSSIASEFQKARVSRANGIKLWVILRCSYFLVLEQAALSAAAPAFEAVDVMWDWANVSGSVTSHVNGLPCDHGINVALSGRLPSDLDSLTGSLPEPVPSWWSSRVDVVN